LSYFINPNFRLHYVDLSDDTTVSSGGGTDTQTLRPNEGEIYVVYNTYANIPAIGGASGDHDLEAFWKSSSGQLRAFKLDGTDGAVMYILGYGGGFAASTEQPSDSDDQMELMMRGGIVLSYDHYMNFVYTNDSDTNQSGTRTLKIWVKVFSEAK